MQSVKPRPPAWQVRSWLFGCTIPKTLSRNGRQARQEGWTAQVLLCDLRVHASGHAGGLVNLTSLGVRPAVRLFDPGGLGETALPEPHSCHSFHCAGPRGRSVAGCSAVPAVRSRRSRRDRPTCSMPNPCPSVFICGWLYGSFSVMADFFKNRPKMAENRSFSLKTCPKWTNFARFPVFSPKTAQIRPFPPARFSKIFFDFLGLPAASFFGYFQPRTLNQVFTFTISKRQPKTDHEETSPGFDGVGVRGDGFDGGDGCGHSVGYVFWRLYARCL